MADTTAREGKIYYESYAKAPRSILMARDLSCQQKVILLQLLDRYDYLLNNGKIKDGEAIYMVGAAFEEQNDLTAQTIQRQIIPGLVEKGLMSKTRRGTGKNKTYSYYSLDLDAINHHDRSAVKPKSQKDKKPQFMALTLDEQDYILREIVANNKFLLQNCVKERHIGTNDGLRKTLIKRIQGIIDGTDDLVEVIADTLIDNEDRSATY